MVNGMLYVAIASSTGWTAANGRNYPWLINEYLKNILNQPNRMINKSIGGTSVDKVIANKYWLRYFDANLITIGIGMNDISASATTDFITKYSSIVDFMKIYNPNAQMMLCAPNNVKPSDATRYANIQRYRDAIQTVANDEDCIFVDFSKGWHEDLNNIYLKDSIHPNESGHQKIFDRVLKNYIDAYYNKTTPIQPVTPQAPSYINNLVNNYNFSNGTKGWTKQGNAETYEIVADAEKGSCLHVASTTANDGVKQSVPLVAGRIYRLSLDVKRVTATTQKESFYGGFFNLNTTVGSWVNYSRMFLVTTAGDVDLVVLDSSATEFYLTNVKVEEVTEN